MEYRLRHNSSTTAGQNMGDGIKHCSDVGQFAPATKLRYLLCCLQLCVEAVFGCMEDKATSCRGDPVI